MRGLNLRVSTGGGWERFGPYVPALDAGGAVWFTAWAGGVEGVLGRAGEHGPEAVTRPGGGPVGVSHPVVDGRGRVTLFARDARGRSRPLRTRPGTGVWVDLAEAEPGIATAGPLGPTADEEGALAFRAVLADGDPAVVRVDADGACRVVLAAREEWTGFEGLPLALPEATVIRANRVDGAAAILRVNRAGAVDRLVETGTDFRALGRFPSTTRDGRVAFAAVDATGESGLWLLDGAGRRRVAGADGGFAEVRGGLVAENGAVAFFATPVGGRLGIYAGPRADRDRIIGLGDRWAGREVTDFAANPVSINRHGQVALRLAFADGSEALARWDPSERAWRPG